MQKNSTIQKPETNLLWQVAILAGPIVLQNLSQTLLGVVDTFFVSRISTEAVAAVGLASILYFAVLMLFRSTAFSTIAFVGRAYGEGDYKKVGSATSRAINMIAWLSLSVLVLPFLFAWLMRFAAPPGDTGVRALGTVYLEIRTFELPFVMLSAVVWAFLVGRGDSRTPMLLAWFVVGLNILLDWMLVLGNWGMPAMGVSGAATASLLANGAGALLSGLILWNRANRERFYTGRLTLSRWADLRTALSIGLPMGAGDFIEIASFSVFFALIARLGTDVLAANQIALQYMSISFTIGGAVGMATSSLVANYLGGQRPDLAEKAAYRGVFLGCIGMGIIGLSYLIAPATLISLFSQEPTVIAAGVTVLRLVAFYQIIDGVGIILAGALNGAGDTRFTMAARTILAWGMFLPLAWVMLFQFERGSWGAWVAALVYLGLLSLVYVYRFRTGIWKTLVIE